MKQILKESEISGKTIKSFKIFDFQNRIFIEFTDNYYCVVDGRYEEDHEYSNGLSIENELSLAPSIDNCNELFELGFMTVEARTTLIENYSKEQETKRQNERIRGEKELLKKLKAKYE